MEQTEFEVWPFDNGCRQGRLKARLYALSHSDAARLYAEANVSGDHFDMRMPHTYTLYVAANGEREAKAFTVRRTYGFSVSPASEV